MNISTEEFGKVDGQAIEKYTLSNNNGASASMITYGGRVTELHVPDQNGKAANIVLGFDNLRQYQEKNPYFGALIGRFGNRIAHGTFEIDGQQYKVVTNEGDKTLHGGKIGYDRRIWKATPMRAAADHVGLQLDYISPDGEEGFPGTLTCRVVYSMNERNELRIDYTATTDKPTPINLTNHSYFNLRGAGNGDILGHEMQLFASHYTPVDDTLIPTGTIAPVQATPMDFRRAQPIGSRIAQVKGGYDHNYVLDDPKGEAMGQAARVVDRESGRTMEVHTTQPGIQFYTGNFLNGSIKGLGGTYGKHAGFCLETQHFPDSVHHSNFPSVILRPGEKYQQTTVYAFGVLKT
ncbi:MAG TPA: aldose epimerase family protein [Tepidisphaeraceae bacterium]|jgi:aldose 1-epimerase|nr:aldose epimerase family protein [Tepidisphaeraceae bacterium]